MSLQALRCAAIGLAFLSSQAMAQDKPSFGQTSSATRVVAERYFNAYVARDWERLEPLLADEAAFSDPTAALVFGTVKREGKAATLKNFKEGYAAIRHMEFHPLRTFVSGEHAVYEGTLDWTLALKDGKQAVTLGMPFICVLRVVDGRVLEHRDLADYAPFLAAIGAARSGS
jgi:ketosteroid isomerase-like protein